VLENLHASVCARFAAVCSQRGACWVCEAMDLPASRRGQSGSSALPSVAQRLTATAPGMLRLQAETKYIYQTEVSARGCSESRPYTQKALMYVMRP